MPRASIIIPCYNADRFVEETVRSAQRQTVDDIEIICVDDGSSDGTLATLKRLASSDARIRVIERENGGEGPARDTGLDAATSPWLYFLDADDLMEPTLLEESIAACERDQSDIVVFKTTTLDMQTGEERSCWYSFQRDWMPDSCFRPQDHPQHVFTSFQNWVHNKLFRASFVHEHDLHMQHVHRTADLLLERPTCSSPVALSLRPTASRSSTSLFTNIGSTTPKARWRPAIRTRSISMRRFWPCAPRSKSMVRGSCTTTPS